MMKETGRAMRLDTNRRRSKIVTLSKGTSASALTGKVCPDLQKQKPKSLDTADVVRDVEKLLAAKLAKIKSCQEAPQSIFSGRGDIFYPPILAVWDEK